MPIAVIFTDIELKFEVEVAKMYPQHMDVCVQTQVPRWARTLVDHEDRKKVAVNLDGPALCFIPDLTTTCVLLPSNCDSKQNQK